MHYKTNRQNHDFQILHFIVGACHTVDGAYAVLCDLREDRSNALRVAQASALREAARILTAKKKLRSWRKVRRLEAQADLAEIEALRQTNDACILAAQEELATIQGLMDKLEPHRQFKHLPLHAAHQAAQHDEWKLELINRAENYLITAGTIPADHFATMRLHPAFATEIYPATQRIQTLIQQRRIADLLEVSTRKAIDLPALLGASA